ncbi:MAG TPA: class I SAM-dependent methyltransferase [Pyrinomonadaceae bacterium]|nr:class I SAM-dependent methyltransferase [Pyrinomonadaceae bacterium]
MSRPFYGEFAWAYELLVGSSVGGRCDFLVELLARRGVARGARVLDAGCGAGAYAIELARRGFVVDGLDASPALVEESRARVAAANPSARRVSFAVGDIVRMDADARYDAVLCRGVLNDLLDDESRREVFRSFARALRAGGVLVFDVREWGATAARKSRAPVFEKTVETARGRLTFRAETRLDAGGRRLLVSERHTLRGEGFERVADFDFMMRPWTREELGEALDAAGFRAVEYFGAYDFASAPGTTDRLVCAASAASSRDAR